MSQSMKSIPARMQVMSPHLIVKEAAKAIEFYKNAFGAKELFRLTEPSGKVGHAEMAIGQSQFMIADEYPDFGALSPVSIGGTPVSLHMYVENVDEAIARAERAGATVLRPPSDEFFGDRVGMVTDPFGHKWQLATRKEEVSPAEMQKRWNKSFE